MNEDADGCSGQFLTNHVRHKKEMVVVNPDYF